MGGKKFKSFEDLRGASIGSSGLTSGTAFVLRRVLRAKGIDRSNGETRMGGK